MIIWTTYRSVPQNWLPPCRQAAETCIANSKPESAASKRFYKRTKINYAAKLLLTTTLTIQEVMYQTAFTNRSHFYRAFAKRYNQTPKEYRETNKQKDNSLSN